MSNNDTYYTNLVENGRDYSLHMCLDYYNKRLRVDDYRGNPNSVFERVQELMQLHYFTKVFIKARHYDWGCFLTHGYMLEAVIKGYFQGHDAFNMALYTDLERRTSDYWIYEDQLLAEVQALPLKSELNKSAAGFLLRQATDQDANVLAALYRQVFATYPTPMHDPLYVEHIIQEGTIFHVAELQGQLVSAASAEINTTFHNAEMTDCATLHTCRNKGLMRLLLQELEQELLRRNITCAYSLARALSTGMNAVFKQLGYEYGGRMTKNCNIYDKFEDMNVWTKTLPQ
ncbi:putative beta-lysine N-acetyltransferase [Paenibacillus sp. UMB4589-SE434]|uniref:putative beta-lysine N-acetyltransferase n=1 Tax=Paenibacillus sp. UMB4589-SE434 TaxID=3046314 RepID=UPI00254C228B|nr:putative beta-lysine N-acetyltransferase [Paenibacillus sp. UMB4589-SE434]MDK8179769.1 putative beta-lysine N-acetyltransferase [Paenibacillus sp. UMB4589-SE434]